MIHFDDVLMSKKILFRSQSMIETSTDQAFSDSGFVNTNKRWTFALRTLSIGFRKPPPTLQPIVDIFLAIPGPNGSFNCRDWADWNTLVGQIYEPVIVTKDDQPMVNTVDGTYLGDASTLIFQLNKRYFVGATAVSNRFITKPESGTVLVAVNGVLQTETTDYTIDYTTGLVTFVVAPPNTETVTWGGNFCTPVKFISDQLPVSLDAFVNEMQSIELQEVRI